MVVTGTAFLLIASKKVEGTLSKMVLDILTWIAAAYLSVIVFFALFPFGLIIGLLGLGITIITLGAIKDTQGFGGRVSAILEQTSALGTQLPLIGPSMSADQASFWRSAERIPLKAYLLPRIHRDTLLEILRERPYLPISVTRYGDIDILFVRPGTETKFSEQMPLILSDLGVHDLQELSSFMTRAILSLPLLEDRESSKSLDDYRLAASESTVNRLIQIWPDRITIIPHKKGPLVLIRSESAPGFEMDPLPRGREIGVILGHETEHIELGDVPIAAESTT
jgi:hypothetical protein